MRFDTFRHDYKGYVIIQGKVAHSLDSANIYSGDEIVASFYGFNCVNKAKKWIDGKENNRNG